jgi:hypothetical protein
VGARDVTIHGVYVFPDGTEMQRATYHSDTRMRATMFDGNEAIYDVKAGQVIFLNHDRKRYWKGPLDRANAVLDSLSLERDRPFFEAAQEKQQEWMKFTEQFNEALDSKPLLEEKKFAGKRCRGWEISAKPTFIHTRWIAEDVVVPDFTAEMHKLLLLPALDPVGRSIGRILIQARGTAQGAILASSTEIATPTQKVSFSWEARRIATTAIPDSVWAVPAGYEEIKL